MWMITHALNQQPDNTYG